MITNITLENFKCFRRVHISPKLITVLIGPNGTGKSGVLQALLLLKQSGNPVGPLVFDGELIQFEPDAFMLRLNDSESGEVQFNVSGYWGINFEGIEDRVDFGTHLSYSSDAKLNDQRDRTWIRMSGGQHEVSFTRWPGQHTMPTPVGDVRYEVLSGGNSFQIRSYPGGQERFLPFWEKAFYAPINSLANMRVVPAARGFGRGLYRLRPTSSPDISNASGLGEQEEDLATTLEYSRPDVWRISELMGRITGVGFRTDTVPPISVKPVSESPAGDFSLVMEGFGTNALVHLLFEVVRAVPGATVLIEEPEIHLHPKAQADLASVMVEEAKSGNKQIVMTTHSEHVAGRLLTLVAEGKLSPDELAIYSFEKDKAGVCSASEIEVTDRGQVSGGLKSFFETDLAEMRRYVEALRAKA